MVNHVAIGPKCWGRAGPDCAIRTDSTSAIGNNNMTETIRIDGMDIALSKDSITTLLGNESTLDGKSDEELKLDVINKFYPEQSIPKDEASYVEGMFNAICGMKTMRNDSLTAAREALQNSNHSKAHNGYEKWLEHSAKLWSIPLAGSAR